MMLTVEAVYENGVLKPDRVLDLAEHQHVMVQVIVPIEATEKPTPTAATLHENWSTVLGDDVTAAIAQLHIQTAAKLAQLMTAQLPSPELISMKGLWSHIAPDTLEEALVDLRSETNRRLQRLANEL